MAVEHHSTMHFGETRSSVVATFLIEEGSAERESAVVGHLREDVYQVACLEVPHRPAITQENENRNRIRFV
jgi:hypothetical protein